MAFCAASAACPSLTPTYCMVEPMVLWPKHCRTSARLSLLYLDPAAQSSLHTVQPLYQHRGQPLLDEVGALRAWRGGELKGKGRLGSDLPLVSVVLQGLG